MKLLPVLVSMLVVGVVQIAIGVVAYPRTLGTSWSELCIYLPLAFAFAADCIMLLHSGLLPGGAFVRPALAVLISLVATVAAMFCMMSSAFGRYGS